MGNGNGNKEVDCNGNKAGGQVTAAAMKRAMLTATRVAGNKEGNINSGKRDGNSKEGGG